MKHGKIKIGIESENLENPKARWGVGRIAYNLISTYARRPDLQEKYELHLYCKSGLPNDPVFSTPGIHIRKSMFPFSSSFNLYYHIAMPFMAMWDRVDVLFLPAYMYSSLYFGKSIAILTPDMHYEFTHGNLPFRYRLAYRVFGTMSAWRATAIMSISHAAKDELVHLFHLSPHKIFVARLGLDPFFLQSNSEDAIPNVGKDVLPEKYILFVGQMFPRRRAKETILAFELIAKKFPDLHFILDGKDNYHPPEIDALIEQVNTRLGAVRVIRYPFLEEHILREAYRRAQLFVYVSSSEAFGFPPVEAASQGTPVVVNDTPLNHELFGDDAFFVSDEKDPESIAHALINGLADTVGRERAKIENIRRMRSLTWDSFVDAFFDAVQTRMLSKK